ncbi:MAG: hypothetical protein JWO08_870 [Verrucomicrobiaceae bacterium]|nr:hypothetical protein [Verrucomicrobiaceae bacterium]
MAQLLVRSIEDSLVQKLKRRASAHGVSVEEEHRRILKEMLNRPAVEKPSLMGFLLSEEGQVRPNVELDLSRSRDVESHREVVL